VTERYIIHLQRQRDAHGMPFWVAWHPRLPGCRGHGATPQAAHAALAECRRDYLRSLEERGEPVPLGDTAISERVIVYVY
jgi:predicted RNase H-like HicB family nuclease